MPSVEQIADLAGAGNRAAEHQNGQAPIVNRRRFRTRSTPGVFGQTQIQHDEIDVREIRSHSREKLGRALDGDRFVARVFERCLKAVAHERRVVGDEDRLRADCHTSHDNNVIGSCHPDR